MATNDFLPFAGAAGANVLTQPAYVALSTIRANGFISGTANAQQLNKVWRQSSIMASVIGQLIVDGTGLDAIDDGTIPTLLANLKKSISGRLIGIQIFSTPGSFTYTPTSGTTSVVVSVQGGGGAGGGSQSTAAGTVSVCPGGNAGSIGRSRLTSGFSGVTVVVGSGGSGSLGAAGLPGGSSSFGSLITAPGGQGGVSYAPATPPVLNINSTAQTSATGGNIMNAPGGRGSPAVASGVTFGGSGDGGASVFGSGGPTSGALSTPTNGKSGISPGSGGSGGAGGAGAAASTGGSGSAGIVIIEEYA